MAHGVMRLWPPCTSPKATLRNRWARPGGMGQHSAELMLTVVMSIAISRVWRSRAAVCSRGKREGGRGVALSSPGQTVRIYGIVHCWSWTDTLQPRAPLQHQHQPKR